ncbi:MAG: sigma-70 family RNA polymerase sigma factor [Bacteroidota bacterium]
MINTDAPFYQTETQISEDWENVLAAKQDIKNFSLIYDKYYVSVFRFVYQRTDSSDDAADITSLVFLKAMQSIQKFVFKGVPFASILFRIAFNEINQHFRKVQKDRNFYLNFESQNELMDEIKSHDSEDKESSVKKLLEYLNPSDLELIEMRYFEKRSFKEIAEITDLTENNAKVKVHRILGKLKQTAEKYNLAEILITLFAISTFIF